MECYLMSLKFVVPVIGLIMSILYGYKCFEIHGIERKKEWSKALVWHQRWFNFVGSAAGWGLLYYFAFHRREKIFECGFAWSDVALMGVMLVGITGYLPSLLGEIAKKALEPRGKS